MPLGSSTFPPFLDWLPDGFDNWDAWVAIGTLLLAAVTFSLVLRTRQDVLAATRSADVAERALATGLRPVLTDIPPEREEGDIEVGIYDGQELIIEVPLRNSGAGLGLLGGPNLLTRLEGVTWRSATTQTAVPAGDTTRLDFRGTFGSAEHAAAASALLETDGASLALEIAYTDLDGGQRQRTLVALRHTLTDDDDLWVVDRIELFSEDAATPFAVLPGRSVSIAV